MRTAGCDGQPGTLQHGVAAGGPEAHQGLGGDVEALQGLGGDEEAHHGLGGDYGQGEDEEM